MNDQEFCFSGCKIENFGSIDLWASKKAKFWGGDCHIGNIEPRASSGLILKKNKNSPIERAVLKNNYMYYILFLKFYSIII